MLDMAIYLRDHQASLQLGQNIFRLPYPGGNWREEKQNNSQIIHLMGLAWDTAVLGVKIQRGHTLTKKEDELLNQISDLLVENG